MSTSVNKFVVALLGLLVTVGLIQMDEATMAQIATGISAILVYLVPNKSNDPQ